MTDDLQQARISVEVLDEYRKIAAWLEAQAATRSPVGDTMHGLAAEALTNLIEHEYSRHTVDAHLPSVEQIAEVLYDEFVTRTDLSMVECERAACAVRALFGEVTGDE